VPGAAGEGTEHRGNPEHHQDELFLALEDIGPFTPRTKSPQTNSILERHKTMLNAFYRIALRNKIDRSINELRPDLDAWVKNDNEQRPHQGRWRFGKTHMQTFLDAMPMAKGKDDRALILPDRSMPTTRRHPLSNQVSASTRYRS